MKSNSLPDRCHDGRQCSVLPVLEFQTRAGREGIETQGSRQSRVLCPGVDAKYSVEGIQFRRYLCFLWVSAFRLFSRPQPISSATGWMTAITAVIFFSAAGMAADTDATQKTWSFGRVDDLDFNGQPDDFRRRSGLGFPAYVAAEIVPKDAAMQQNLAELDSSLLQAYRSIQTTLDQWAARRPGRVRREIPLPPSVTDALVDRYYQIKLDGGQFSARSKTIPANPMYRYRLRCQMRCQSLRFDQASVELVFVDSSANELTSYSTQPVSGDTDWTRMELSQLSAPAETAGYFVRLRVLSNADGLEDIRGEIGFDEITVDRSAQLRITADRVMGVYRPDDSIQITATELGLDNLEGEIEFKIINQDDEIVVSGTRLASDQMAAPLLAGVESSAAPRPKTTVWDVGALPPGFYKIYARSDRDQLDATSSIAVIQPSIDGPASGPFGWSLDRPIDDSIAARIFADYLLDSGVSLVTYPCNTAIDDAATTRILAVAGEIQDRGIAVIGRIAAPDTAGVKTATAAEYFDHIDQWQSRWEPTMTRLTLKIRTWQLGNDDDFSFLRQNQLGRQIQLISRGLQGFGQPLQIALPWPWLEPTLSPDATTWGASLRSSDPPLTADELRSALDDQESNRSVDTETWLKLSPISASKFSRDDRIADLVLRMAAVRSHRVAAAFVPVAHSDGGGILNDQGLPGELYLPFRTTSRLIGNLRGVGSLRLKSQIDNLVLAGGERAVVMAWSPEPRSETIYLGDDVSMIDVWGRRKQLPTMSDGRQILSTGPLPVFIVGSDPVLLAFRMGVELTDPAIDSIINRTQPFRVEATNPTRQNLAVAARPTLPSAWNLSPAVERVETSPGQTVTASFSTTLSNTAKIGDYWIPIEFDIQTDPPRRIVVHRKATLGPVGLMMESSTRWMPDGSLRVTVQMTNTGSRVQAYDCLLFPPPGRRYQLRFVTLQPGETIRRDFLWPQADDLAGQTMLLRAAEQDGQRVLNYEIELDD